MKTVPKEASMLLTLKYKYKRLYEFPKEEE